jgi:archaellum component FlaC
MADDETLREILALLRDIQATVKDVQAEQRNQKQVTGWIRQSLRMQKAALNDFEKTRVSSGEVATLHEELDAAIARIDELSIEIEKLKGAR